MINFGYRSICLILFGHFLYVKADSTPAIHRHRHQQHKMHDTKSKQQSKSLSYPNEVCRDRRYWKTLPNPEGVIGYGYNLMTGRQTQLPIFNTSIYDENECRLSGRRSNGTQSMHRLPAYVSIYTFYDESDPVSKLRFRYRVYNSTPKALMDARKSRSLPMESDEATKYEHLYVKLRSAPIRYYAGARSYYEAVDDLALNSRNIQTKNRLESSAAPVLYSLGASATTGEFELKSKNQLSWRYLSEQFRQRLRRAIVDDDFSKGFFDEMGTHYAKGGTFGGVSERWWISRRRPERKCNEKEESRILDADLMAACDRFRLAGSDDESDNDKHGLFGAGDNDTNVFSVVQSLSDRCHSVFDDERFRTSRWMVTSGAPPERLRAAHIQQAAFSGRSGEVQLQQWLSSLNDEPSTVKVELAPICDLLSLVDERPWHMEKCQDQLLTYVKAKDPFYAGKSVKTCSHSEIALKFEKQTQNGVTPTEKGVETTTSHYVHCVPTTTYLPERTCRAAAVSRGSNFTFSKFIRFLCIWFCIAFN